MAVDRDPADAPLMYDEPELTALCPSPSRQLRLVAVEVALRIQRTANIKLEALDGHQIADLRVDAGVGFRAECTLVDALHKRRTLVV